MKLDIMRDSWFWFCDHRDKSLLVILRAISDYERYSENYCISQAMKYQMKLSTAQRVKNRGHKTISRFEMNQ